MKRLTLLGAAAATAATAGVLATGGASSAQTAGLPAMTVAVSGDTIAVGGELRSGAVQVTATTTGSKEAEATLVHLKPGVSAADLGAQLPRLRDPNDVSAYGSIVFDATATHDGTTQETVLPAGDYVALDTSGPNPAKFPHTEFTVTESDAPAALAKPDATVRAIDFGFRAPKTLRRGTVVRFQNDGYVVHMIDAIRAKDAKGAKRISRLLRRGKDGKAQRLSAGFAAFQGPVSHGAVQQLKVTAKPGTYVFACFMSTQDGRPHTRLGMTRVVRIK